MQAAISHACSRSVIPDPASCPWSVQRINVFALSTAGNVSAIRTACGMLGAPGFASHSCVIAVNSCRSRGFGFITFMDIASADLILSLETRPMICGKVVEVKRAVPREQLQQSATRRASLSPFAQYGPTAYGPPPPYPLPYPSPAQQVMPTAYAQQAAYYGPAGVIGEAGVLRTVPDPSDRAAAAYRHYGAVQPEGAMALGEPYQAESSRRYHEAYKGAAAYAQAGAVQPAYRPSPTPRQAALAQNSMSSVSAEQHEQHAHAQRSSGGAGFVQQQHLPMGATSAAGTSGQAQNSEHALSPRLQGMHQQHRQGSSHDAFDMAALGGALPYQPATYTDLPYHERSS